MASGDYASLTSRNSPIHMANDSDELETERPKLKTVKFWQRLGLLDLITLLFGFAILPLTLLVLALVWRESTIARAGGEPKAFWFQMVGANWTTRVITISTSIMRIAIALQASLSTAFIAGLIVEKIGIPLIEGPLFSIMRALYVAPVNLLYRKSFLPKGPLSVALYAIVVLEVLVTVSSQFLSTIYLSDCTDSTFTDRMNTTYVGILNGSRRRSPRSRPWETHLLSSWTFAELSEPFIKGQNFHDTGHTFRSFPPLEDEVQRMRLRQFRGPAIIMDQRVVCANPSLINVTLHKPIELPNRNANISGQISLNIESYPMLQEARQMPAAPTETNFVSFVCVLPTNGNASDGIMSLCFPKVDQRLLILRDSLVGPEIGGYGYAEFVTPIAFLVLDVLAIDGLRRGNVADDMQIIHNEGPWATAKNGSNVEILRITACMANLLYNMMIVDMHRAWEGLEPKMSWDHQARKYDTETIRRQLGASLTPETARNRGILSLGPRSRWQNFTDAEGFADFQKALVDRLRPLADQGNGQANPGVFFAPTDGDDTAGHAQTSLFLSVLRDTQSPALASQALFARIFQMELYDRLPQTSTRAAAETSFSSTALIPVRWTGFTAAAMIVATHLMLIMAVTVLFLCCTENSWVGNAWQAVSQVVSDDTTPLLERADRMTDKDTRRWAKQQSVDVKRCGVVRYRHDGRVALSVQGDEQPLQTMRHRQHI
ncbi:hypothetical protein XA68_15102 [Ophiocordyceps unilateralis]|uniref:Uncharacterized protein n=1 Tax=Ophiocordyceps unilateralis TaxID=268505 RepID=A0A2A9P887_OPHUN|nr:hypothetical protein XA68_15102 [Ophiocordyceps unilateralis]